MANFENLLQQEQMVSKIRFAKRALEEVKGLDELHPSKWNEAKELLEDIEEITSHIRIRFGMNCDETSV